MNIIQEKLKQKNHSSLNQIKINIFAIGDTFGNVALYEYSNQENKCNLLFLHKNKEIGYSIESLSFENKGNLLIASTSKHFLLLFYIGSMNKISLLNKVSKKDFFKQNCLNMTNNQLLDKLTFANFTENKKDISAMPIIQTSTNKTNKPVFFRKTNSVNKNIITFKKKIKVEDKPKNKIFVEKPELSKTDFFKLQNNLSKHFVSVINILTEPPALLTNTLFKFDLGSVHFIKNAEISQIEGFKIIVSFNDWENLSSYTKNFKGNCLGIQVNSKYLLILSDNDKINVFFTKNGKKAMLSFFIPNFYSFYLNQDSLMIVKKNSYFSVINLSFNKTLYSGNCFELLDKTRENKEEMICNAKFILSPSNQVFVILEKNTYMFNKDLLLWQMCNNFIFSTECTQLTITSKNLDFPKDPSEIFDHIPFSMIEAIDNISKP